MVDKIGIDKFITVPAASSKLSNVVDSDVVVAKVNTSLSKINTIDTEVPRTNKLITKKHNDFDKQILEKKGLKYWQKIHDTGQKD